LQKKNARSSGHSEKQQQIKKDDYAAQIHESGWRR
jgi:hypothetical protein